MVEVVELSWLELLEVGVGNVEDEDFVGELELWLLLLEVGVGVVEVGVLVELEL